MILCPASNGGTPVLGAEWNRALCSGRPPVGFHLHGPVGLPLKRVRTAVSQNRLAIRPYDINCGCWRHYAGNHKGCPYEYEVGAKRGDIDSRMPGFCRGDRPVALVLGKQRSAAKSTIGSHEGTETQRENQQSAKGGTTPNPTGVLPNLTATRPVAAWGVFPRYSVQHRGTGKPDELVGHPISIYTHEAIRGKTGSAPSGLPAPLQ